MGVEDYLEGRLRVCFENILDLPRPGDDSTLQNVDLVLVMENHRLLRGNIRRRQWQQSLALDLANGDKDCIAPIMVIANSCLVICR